MGALYDTIRQLVAEEKYVVGEHVPSDWKNVVSWSGRLSRALTTEN
jgi:hypothetical protein